MARQGEDMREPRLHQLIISRHGSIVNVVAHNEVTRLLELRMHASWWMLPNSLQVLANDCLQEAVDLVGIGLVAEANDLAGDALELIAEELAVA